MTFSLLNLHFPHFFRAIIALCCHCSRLHAVRAIVINKQHYSVMAQDLQDEAHFVKLSGAARQFACVWVGVCVFALSLWRWQYDVWSSSSLLSQRTGGSLQRQTNNTHTLA